jgi:hypothetical protein
MWGTKKCIDLHAPEKRRSGFLVLRVEGKRKARLFAGLFFF